MLSEGQRNDINFAIPVLEHINIEGSSVLADRGYDSQILTDYIYKNGGEPTIPSKKGAKFERRCDWWLYKERHLVEKYFLKLKGFRRIATRYDKLAFTYMGFVCLASILIWNTLDIESELSCFSGGSVPFEKTQHSPKQCFLCLKLYHAFSIFITKIYFV